MEGLTDPSLPPLIDEARETLAATHPNAYAAAAVAPNAFISLSPMTHDPLYPSRLSSDRRIWRVAVVYDFIPKREPARYLPTAADRIGYAIALRALAKHQLFAPISQSAADDLVELLHIPRSRIVVTGAPAEDVFAQAPRVRAERPARHLLVVGGGDPRKNPEVVIRAHAKSGLLQRMGVPLVIAGSYGVAERQTLQALGHAAGGRADLVEVPGHVTEAALLNMYALAHAIVCPSRDEGFSLPVVEGMAAGLPCLASDIPAHRELVTDASARFAPDDDAALGAALERVVQDAPWRDAMLQRQAYVWPRFRASEVGRRFWDAVQVEPSPARPAILRRLKPRVALLSPLPPDRSGVADYTAATCGPLGELVDLHLFTETADPVAMPNVSSVRPLSALPHLTPGFDRVVSVVGNSHFHLRIFEYLLRYGGACIAHDARMLGFYAVLLGSDKARETASRELGREVPQMELDAWCADERDLKAMFLGEIVAAARPLIVHSRVTMALASDRYGVTPAHVPFSIYHPSTAAQLAPRARAAARERLGLAPEQVAIVTLGFVQKDKAPEECIHALEQLRRWGVNAVLHFGGSRENIPDRGAALDALARSLGVSDYVHYAHGFVSKQTYDDYLAGSDLAIQLRTYGLGGLSGALLDCAAAGLPTVTNASLAEAVDVPSYIRPVPDGLSPFLMAEALVGLLENGRDVRLEQERATFCQARSLSSYAYRLCGALDLSVVDRAQRTAA